MPSPLLGPVKAADIPSTISSPRAFSNGMRSAIASAHDAWQQTMNRFIDPVGDGCWQRVPRAHPARRVAVQRLNATAGVREEKVGALYRSVYTLGLEEALVKSVMPTEKLVLTMMLNFVYE